MAPELPVPLANVYAHLGTLVMQMTIAKDAFYVDNVKSIKIVRALKFASSSAVASEIVLMHVANSHADQMHYVFRIIIVQLVFVAMALLVIQMISMLAVNQAKCSECQTHARVMWIVNLVKSVLLVSMELKIA